MNHRKQKNKLLNGPPKSETGGAGVPAKEETGIRVLEKRGLVSLVGAGPGDPELISVKGARRLAKAEVVIYDRLVHPELLREGKNAELICVGKKGGYYTFSQQKINRLLVDKARQDLRVVRLKGGDPFLFGRGGEEALYLLQHDVSFEVIPGISSALAAPAAAGIPLTHRELSSTVTFVTGHQRHDSDHPVRWELLARSSQTLVILMPLGNLETIAKSLLQAGRSWTEPCVLIQSATWETERVLYASLKTVARRARRENFSSPALLVVGPTAGLGKLLGHILKPRVDGVPAKDTRVGS